MKEFFTKLTCAFLALEKMKKINRMIQSSSYRITLFSSTFLIRLRFLKETVENQTWKLENHFKLQGQFLQI